MCIYMCMCVHTQKRKLNDEKEEKQPLLVPCLTDRETGIEWTKRSRRREKAKRPAEDRGRKIEVRSLAAVGSHGCAAYLHLLSPLSLSLFAAFLLAHRSFSASRSPLSRPNDSPSLLSFHSVIHLSPLRFAREEKEKKKRNVFFPRFALSRLHLASPASFSISSVHRWNNFV